jgi:hypothetical protein
MAKADVYRSYRVSSAGRSQIRGFTQNSLTQMWQAEVRRQASGLGYTDRAIKLADAQTLSDLASRAADKAGEIERGFNSRIASALQQMPEGLADTEYIRLLNPALRAIHQYNQDQMLPNIGAWARQKATLDFHQQNGIQSLFELQPTDTAGVQDGCDDAVALGETDAQTAADYPMPAHQNCPHGWVVTSVDQSSLPDQDALWLGE